MGSWNGTCAITQLPIKRGEKVICFILKKDKYADSKGGGFVQSHNQYKPISMPMLGEYDDYGGVENIDEMGEIVFEQFLPLLNDSVTNCNDLKPKDIRELIHFIERGWLVDTALMLVHENIYRRMVEELGSRMNYDGGNTFKEVSFQYIYGYINKAKKLNGEGHLYDLSLEDSFLNAFLRKLDLHFYKRKIIEDSISLITTMSDFVIFFEAMSISRKLWIPQAGAGSQDEEYYIPKIIANFILEKEKSLHDEYKKENIDYEDVEDEIGKAFLMWL